MTQKTKPTAEIVTFRLKDGTDETAFLAAAEGMMPFLHKTGAVKSRTLSKDENGVWTDHLRWTSYDAAITAAEQMIEQPEAEPFMALIDPDSVTMRHAAIHLHTE